MRDLATRYGEKFAYGGGGSAGENYFGNYYECFVKGFVFYY